MPKRDDSLLIEDIYESGTKIQRYISGYSFEGFSKDERTVDAVIRNFEIIGEAARNPHLLFCKNILLFHGLRSLATATFLFMRILVSA